jgi:hypothetical protein
MSDTNRQLMPAQYCDWGRCSAASCWPRCQIPNGRWDGSPTHWYREVWKALRRKPRQLELV